MVAFGSTAPDGSVAVPLISPKRSCATAGMLIKRNTANVDASSIARRLEMQFRFRRAGNADARFPALLFCIVNSLYQKKVITLRPVPTPDLLLVVMKVKLADSRA